MCFFTIIVLLMAISPVLGIQRVDDNRKAIFGSAKGKILRNHTIAKHSVKSPLDCSFECTNNAQCLSYDYKPKGAGEKDVCKLNNATRTTNPGSYQKDEKHIHYYDKEIEDSRSCLDYLRNGATEDGVYIITDTTGVSFKVWCDLTAEPGSAWTLILSFALKNRRQDAFCKRSLAVDVPLNEGSPNWEAYRLSLSRMQHLSSHSTHWRATTGFSKYGVDYKDYIRGKKSIVDIIRDLPPYSCIELDYVNIRGYSATSINVSLHQKDNICIMHADSFFAECPFNKAVIGALPGENNFGFYCEGDASMNPTFRGTKNDESTTELWYGGYL